MKQTRKHPKRVPNKNRSKLKRKEKSKHIHTCMHMYTCVNKQTNTKRSLTKRLRRLKAKVQGRERRRGWGLRQSSQEGWARESFLRLASKGYQEKLKFLGV